MPSLRFDAISAVAVEKNFIFSISLIYADEFACFSVRA